MNENDDGFVSGEPTPRDPPPAHSQETLEEIPPTPSLAHSTISSISSASHFASASSSLSDLNAGARRQHSRPPSRDSNGSSRFKEALTTVSLVLNQAKELERVQRQNEDLERNNEDLERDNETLRHEVFELTSHLNESQQYRRSNDDIQLERRFSESEGMRTESVDTGVQATPLHAPVDMDEMNRLLTSKHRITKCLSEDDIFVRPLHSAVQRVENGKANFGQFPSMETFTHPEAAMSRLNSLRFEDKMNPSEDMVKALTTLTDELGFATKRSDELEDQLEEELVKNKRLVEDIGAEQRRVEQAENEMKHLRNNIEDFKRRIIDFEKDAKSTKKHLQETTEKLVQLTTITLERDQLRRENQRNLTELDYLRHKIASTPEPIDVQELAAQMETLKGHLDEANKRVAKAEENLADHIAVVRKAAECEAQLEVTKGELDKKMKDIAKVESDIEKWKVKHDEERISHLAAVEMCNEVKGRLTQLLQEREETIQLLCHRLAQYEVITDENGEVSLDRLQPGMPPNQLHNEDPDNEEPTLVNDEPLESAQIGQRILERLLELLERFPPKKADDFVLDVKTAIATLLQEIRAQEAVDDEALVDSLNKFFDAILLSYAADMEKLGEKVGEAENDRDKLGAELEKSNAELEAKRRELTVAQERLSEENRFVRNARAKQQDLEERMQKMRAAQSDEQRKADIEQEHRLAQMDELHSALAQKRADFERTAGALKEAVEELEECDRRVVELNREISSMEDENGVLRKEIKATQLSLETAQQREQYLILERNQFEREVRRLKVDLQRENKENETRYRVRALEEEMNQVRNLHDLDKATNVKSAKALEKCYFDVRARYDVVKNNHAKLLSNTNKMVAKIEECNRLVVEQGNPELTDKFTDVSARYRSTVQRFVAEAKRNDEAVADAVQRGDEAIENLRGLELLYQTGSASRPTHQRHFSGASSTSTAANRQQ
ncbi:unnamed protein product, partial [Mesorhabditis belari]|uniref:Uncharacterized protein n=1 Tax=Mesorhabditis belari TaxID=2138241 RepID=A0AAF3F104_9BILA